MLMVTEQNLLAMHYSKVTPINKQHETLSVPRVTASSWVWVEPTLSDSAEEEREHRRV